MRLAVHHCPRDDHEHCAGAWRLGYAEADRWSCAPVLRAGHTLEDDDHAYDEYDDDDG